MHYFEIKHCQDSTSCVMYHACLEIIMNFIFKVNILYFITKDLFRIDNRKKWPKKIYYHYIMSNRVQKLFMMLHDYLCSLI